MPITEAAKAHLAKLAERGAQAPKQAEEAPVVETEAEETPTEGE